MKELVENPQHRLLMQTGATVVLALIFISLLLKARQKKLPLLNGRRHNEFTLSNAKSRFLFNAEELIRSGLTKTRKAFRICTDVGTHIMVSPEYANEIRNHEHLVVDNIIADLFHSDIPGFEAFRADFLNRKLLTKTLSKCLNPSLEWKEVILKPTVLRLVSRLSCRVFCGEELCDNDNWLRITEDYTVTADTTAKKLWLWPWPMRYVVHWFMPSCRILRSYLTEARQILNPIIEKRKTERLKREKVTKTEKGDMIDWLEDTADGGFYEPIAAQLVLSVAAIHTTSDMLTQVVYDVFQRPELVNDLRQELISVVREQGSFNGACLSQLKLMDSVLKESQRLKPFSLTSMHRRATENVTLSDGLEIAKGWEIEMPCLHMWDDTVYPAGQKFVPDRFLKMRQISGQENKHQLVSTSSNHLGFGYGKYACPGRFFAAVEVKIALSHILMSYDVKLADDAPAPHRIGVVMAANVLGRVAVRGRQPEVSL
ncbi:unnamed protein product [Penicillium olsonii]|nr:unnamed protein product [Penicillium olsonii]